jgi:hypothetical protein
VGDVSNLGLRDAALIGAGEHLMGLRTSIPMAAGRDEEESGVV